MKSNRTV